MSDTDNVDNYESNPEDKAKLSFIVWKVFSYMIFIFILMWTLNGGAGAVVEYMVAHGVEWIRMSTFGTALVGMGLLIAWAALQYGVDKIFENIFNITTKKQKK